VSAETPLEPLAPPSEMARWEHTRLRRRMLGYAPGWRDDLSARVVQELRSSERADAWMPSGRPDTTGNIFSPTCRALATLYAPDPPRPSGAGTGRQLVLDAVAAGGLWDILIRGQRDCIGLREWLVRVDAREDPAAPLGWSLSFRPAYPDRIVATARRGAPDLPATIREAVFVQRDGDTMSRWYWESWAIEGDGAPYHRWEAPNGRVLEEQSGEAYPYWDADRQPVLPYSLYHAERTGYLWDWLEWEEIVEGSLRLGVYWTYFGHLLKSASWPQRYMAGLTLASDIVQEQVGDGTAPSTLVSKTGRARPRVPADPALVLQLQPDPESNVQPLIGAFPLSADPEIVANGIGLYERRVTGLAGIDPASVRRDSGDPRSGYAITVSRDAQLEQQSRFRPQFSRGDLETLRVSAAVLGSAAEASLPGDGYTIEYGPPVAVAAVDGAEADPGAGAPAAVQDTALNGAQVASAEDVVIKVALGQLPRGSGLAMLRIFFRLSEGEAGQIMDTVGNGFVPTPEGGSSGAQRSGGGGAPGDAGDGGGQAPGGGSGGGGAPEGAGDGAGGAQDGAGHGGG
jgi:hypothetical protein